MKRPTCFPGNGWSGLSAWRRSCRERAAGWKTRRLAVEMLEDRRMLSLSTFGGIPTWVEQGPALIDTIYGGKIGSCEAIAVHPTDPDVVYVGSVNGGIWRTENASYSVNDGQDNDGDGTTDEADEVPSWAPLADQWPGLSISAIAFDPLDGSHATLYAGRGDFSSINMSGPLLGLLKTTNAGQTWTEVGRNVFSGRSVEDIVPTELTGPSGQTILVATSSGLYRSTNTGSTWTQISGTSGLPAGRVTDLAADPSNTSRFWAAVARHGVYRSTDGGLSWTAVNTGLTALADTARITLDVHSNQNAGTHALYAALMKSGRKFEGVFRSTTFGNSWAAVGTAPNIGGRDELMALAADPDDSNVVFVSSVWGPFRGDASTGNWENVQTSNATRSHDDKRRLVFDLQGNLLEASDGGVYRLWNPNGDPAPAQPRKWELYNSGMRVTEFNSVAYDSLNDIILGGTQDNASIQQRWPGSWQYQGVHGADGGTAAVEISGQTAYRYTTGNHWGDWRRSSYDGNNYLLKQENLRLASAATPNSYMSGLVTEAARKPPPVAYFPYVTNRYGSPDPSTPWPLLMSIGGRVYESFDRGDTITDVSPGGFEVQQYATNTTIDSLADADAVIAAGVVTSINYSDTPGGSQGRFASDAAFPGGNDDNFAIHVTATLNVMPAQVGYWTFGVNSDDGSRLRIDGRQVIRDDSLHAPQDRFGTYYLSWGYHKLDFVFFDHLGGAAVELFAAAGSHTSFNPSFQLVTAGGGPGLHVTSEGFAVRQYVSNTAILDLGNVDDLINPKYAPEINFSESPGGSQGHFGSDAALPRGNDDDFVLRATATVYVRKDQEGTWTFGTSSDDGCRLLIDGNVVIEDDGLHLPKDTFGTLNLASGQHELELIFFDRAGGASIELMAAKGSYTTFNANFKLITSGKTSGLQPHAGWRSRVFAVAYGSAVNDDVIYAGGVDFTQKPPIPQVWVRSTSGGGSAFRRAWSYPGAGPHDIAIDPNDWRTAYVLDLNGDTGNIWRTTDAGESWTNLSEDPDGARWLPKRLRTIEFVRIGGTPVLLVGGEGGVYRRINPAIGTNSGSWREFGRGLPNMIVEDLHYDPTDKLLLAGTAGRGAWTIYNADLYLPVVNPLTVNGDGEFQPPEDVIRLVANPNILDTDGDAMWLHAFVNNTGNVPDYSVEFGAIRSIVVNGRNGKDWIRIEDLPPGVGLTVNGGSGDDFISLDFDDSNGVFGGAGNPVINGDDGADYVSVDPSTETPVRVYGGSPAAPTSPADTLNVVTGGATTNVQQGPNPDEGTVTVAGHDPVTYDGIETRTLDGPVFPPDRFEENDSFAAAGDLAGGDQTQAELNIDHAGDDDWYKWTANAGGTLIVEARFRHNAGNLDLALYNSGGSLLADSTTNTDDEYIIYSATAGQTYYIRVSGHGGAINPDYALEITWPFGVGEDNLEPNDTFAQAHDLGKGDQTRTHLTVHKEPGSEFISNDDWYKWKAWAPGTLTVDLLFLHTLGDLNLELYNSSQSLLASSTSTTDNEQVSTSLTPGEVYYIRVYGQTGATNPNYDLKLDGPEIDPDVFEPNNTAEQALDLVTGDYRLANLTVHNADDEDWFKWTANGDGTLNIDLQFTHDLGDLDLALYDASAMTAPIEISNSSNDDEHIVLSVTAGRTFYIQVYGYLGATNYQYHLEIGWPLRLPPDRFEPNETRAGAHDLVGGDQTHTGLSIHRPPEMEFDSSDDWYKWRAWDDGLLTADIRFADALGDLDLKLYDSTGAQRAQSTSSTDNEQVTTTVAAGETYYIQVYGYQGVTNPAYDLVIDGPDLLPDMFEPNDSLAQAFPLGMGDQAYQRLTLHAPGNDDWYRFKAADDGTLDVAIGFNHALGDLDLELYNADGTPLTFSNSSTNMEQVTWSAAAGQEYYIRVLGYNGATNRDYEIEVNGPDVPADAYEPNDSSPTAYDLGAEERILPGLTIHEPNNDDWFQWTAPADGVLQVDALFSHALGDVDLELHNTGGDRLAESRSTTDDEHLLWPVEAGQSYLIRAYGAPMSTIQRRRLLGPPVVVYDGALQRDYELRLAFRAPPTVDAGPDGSAEEGAAFTSAGTFTDPGSESWTATVDYGDGSGATPLPLTGQSFQLSHVYADEGVYTVSVTVTDNDGDSGSGWFTVSVANLPPQITLLELDSPTIDEGGTVTLTGSFLDPGVEDTHTAEIDWGDGQTTPAVVDDAAGRFTALHQYLQDAAGGYTIRATLSDDGGGQDVATTNVVVNNAAPAVDAGPDQHVGAPGTFAGSGSFSDPGADTWTATVDYGDGTPTQALELQAGNTFALSHSYTRDGVFTVTVTVSDGRAAANDAVLVYVDRTAPTVTGVEVNGRADRTVSTVVAGTGGIETIGVRFNEPVFFSEGGVTVRAVTFPGGEETVNRTIEPQSVAGLGTNVVTITFGATAAVDTWAKVMLTGGAIADSVGNALDGESPLAGSGRGYLFDPARDLPSGDGAPGGDAVFYVGSLTGDANGDRQVNDRDLNLLLSAFGSGGGVADFNRDGAVGAADLTSLLASFGNPLDALPLGLGSPAPIAAAEYVGPTPLGIAPTTVRLPQRSSLASSDRISPPAFLLGPKRFRPRTPPPRLRRPVHPDRADAVLGQGDRSRLHDMPARFAAATNDALDRRQAIRRVGHWIAAVDRVLGRTSSWKE